MWFEILSEGYEDRLQQKPQPFEQEAEVVAAGGEHGVIGIAGAVSEVVGTPAAVGFDDRSPARRRPAMLRI